VNTILSAMGSTIINRLLCTMMSMHTISMPRWPTGPAGRR
jgi:hypothetical protein